MLDPRVQAAAGGIGQAVVAARMRDLLAGAALTPEGPDRLVQDPYPFRVLPQVDGVTNEALVALEQVVTRECNSRPENALIEDGEALPNGNFHGAALGAALDALRSALAQSASLIAARVSSLIDPRMTGLTPFLADDPGVDSGVMMLEYTAHSAAAEARSLATPMSTQAAWASLGVESHASLAGTAARRTADAIAAMRVLVASESVVAVRALRLKRRIPAGAGTSRLFEIAIRELPPGLEDRAFGRDVELAQPVLRAFGDADRKARSSFRQADFEKKQPGARLWRPHSDQSHPKGESGERTMMGVQERRQREQLWGGETTKAVANFPVSGETVPVPVLRWLGRIKGAAARVNSELGLLDAERAKRIAAAADRVAAGEFDDQFPIDVFQTGSGTSSNMNANEVIANLAGEGVHANDDVNMGQSSNDVFPSAVHLAALDTATHELLPALERAGGGADGQGRRVPRRGQVRTHPPDGRGAGDARPGVRRLRGAGPARRAARLATRCHRWRRSRSAAPPPAPGSTPTRSSPRACVRT